MSNSYWSRTLATRVSRRRALVMGGGAAAGAAFLAACGGDSAEVTPTPSNGQQQQPADSVVTQPEDTFRQAVRGGTLRDYVTAESQTLDPIAPVAPLNQVIRHTYGSLVREEPGHLAISSGVMTGDMAESWEIAPDRLRITMKLRPGVKWHNKAPVNGREADIDDVLFSWQRYTEFSPYRALAYAGVNPDAPIESVSAADASTLVISLREPLSYALNYFAIYGSQSGNLMMTPKEADGGYDIRHEMIGHGPFVLTESVPAVGYTFERHREYHDPDWALIDKIESPIVPEYAARLAQFKTGNIHRLFGNDPLAEDVIGIKRDDSRINLYQTEFAATAWILVFGLLPEGESPFLDERVRQAFSMGIDREAWIDAIFNVAGYETDGLPVESRWNTHLLSFWDGYWLDPQSADFGPNAKYFQYDVAEAKKLLAAAGYPNGFRSTSSYPIERLPLQRWAEPVDGMIRELGIDFDINTPDYATIYIPQYRDGQGQYEGWAYGSVTGVMPQVLHPASSFAAEYWPKGGVAFRGFSTSGRNDMSGDPELTRMIERARLEFDDDALREQSHEIQRYLAKAMWGLNMPGGATGYQAAWPALQNVGVWRVRQSASANMNAYRLWVDQTQAPNA